MTYEEALTYIHSVQWRGSKPGLSRTQALLTALGNPEKQLRFIHVAGTNGKGSTSAMLACILQAAGFRTGLYISPFINRFNERMQVNGQEIPDGRLAELTARIRPLADAMDDKPTEFEMITAIGMLYFLEEGCDIVVLEVGMGGELDSTNVIPVPELAVIVNIGLDHTRELGPTMADIAGAKAGILKHGGRVVSYGHNPEADAVIERTALERGCSLTTADFSRIGGVSASLDALTFDFSPYRALVCHLVGAYQLKNAAVALTAVETLQKAGWHIPESAIREGLSQVRWPARFEVLGRDPVFVADGGHNPQGVTAAVESIRLYFPGKRIVFLTGVMADKDVSTMLPIIAPVAAEFVTVRPDNPRSMAADVLAEKLCALGFHAAPCASISEGVALALQKAAAGDGVACALGSLYMQGDVRRCFLPHKENHD